MIVYRQHQQPGCGGCLFAVALILLALGGAPLLFDFLGFLLFAILFLFFAVIVAFVGFSYYIRRQISKYEQSQTESHNKFVFLLVNILIKIAQLDGTVSKEEMHTITNFFRYNLNYTQNQLYWVRDLIKEALETEYSLDSLIEEFRRGFVYEPRLILLELIYQVVFTNAKVSDAELELLQNIAEHLEIFPYDQHAIRDKYIGQLRKAVSEEVRYFEVLGLQPGAGFDQIKSAYRQLSMKYHPDKVNHLGEEFRRVAEEKMKEINAAYNYLKNKYA